MLRDPLLGEATPLPTTELRLGQASIVDGTMQVVVGGLVQSCRYMDPTVLADGDPVIVAFMGGATGQSEAVVIGRTTARPRPGDGQVTAVPGGSSTITVATAEGNVSARFVASYSPAVGDQVIIDWQSALPTVTGKVGATAAPAPPPGRPSPPPGGATSGTSTFAAIDSGTARVGSGWNSPSGQNLWQGARGGPAFAGAWFYGTAPMSLQGRAITGARLFIGARRRMGNHNDPATLHLYGHTSTHRPGGDVSRTVGPADVGMPPGWGGGWVNIPGPIAARVIAGGGIGIAGNPYAGVAGRGENPMSGTLSLDWRK